MKISWKRQKQTGWALASYRLGMFSLPVLVVAVLAQRAHLAPPPHTLPALGLAFGLGMAGVVMGLVALVRIWNHGFEGTRAAFAGIFHGLLVNLAPAVMAYGFITHPPIHDISTDLERPLEFNMALQARPVWANDVRTLPQDVRDMQRAAYPAIGTMRLEQSPAEVYAIAAQMVEKLGWRILDRRAPDKKSPGRIEATARTLVLRFEDDIVLGITPMGNDTLVDMRSASRFGRHDAGTNARRIQSFLADLREQASER